MTGRTTAVRATLLVVALLTFAGCAPSAGPMAGLDTVLHPAGFWKGLWHGFILVFTFLVSLFRDDVGIYETYNNGSWYNFGFVLGVMMFLGGGGGGACKSRKNR